MSENTRPLARIRLPSHHPAIHGMKKGGRVMLHAVRADDTEEDVKPVMQEGAKPKGAQPPPLEREFHVLHIAPMAQGTRGSDAVKFLKSKQDGGREVT